MSGRERSLEDIKKVILHCSDSTFGDAELIDSWHKGRGWSGIGYHFVVLNGYRSGSSGYEPRSDGLVERGRPLELVGAHCKGFNRDSIGICMIGRREFSERQFVSLANLLRQCMWAFKLKPADIYGHCHFNRHKTCPNFDVIMLRALLYEPDKSSQDLSEL